MAAIVPPGAGVPGDERYIGTIDIVRERRTAGWPVPLWVEVTQATVTLDRGDGAHPLDLRAKSPDVDAIRAALARRGPEALTMVTAPTEEGIQLGAAAAAFGVTWMVLLPLGLGLIQVMRGVTALSMRSVERRRRRLRAMGRCHQCGYDLTGAEFSAACPECGTVLI